MGCTSRNNSSEFNLSEPGQPIVFIHGIKGSKLVDASGKIHWLDMNGVLGFGNPSLGLPIDWAAGQPQKDDDLSVAGILDGIFFGIFPKDIYGKWIERLKGLRRPVYLYAYDWRRENGENTVKFTEFLRGVIAKAPGHKIEIVAHSMGGLITLAALNGSPELATQVSRVLFAGVPFQGGVGFFPDIHQGAPTGFNSELLAPEVIGTFPSVYSFFPSDGHGVKSRDGSDLKVSFFDVETWKKYRWGMLHPDFHPTERTVAFVKMALDKALEFRKKLDFNPVYVYPKFVVVRGTEEETMIQIQEEGPRSIRGWDSESLPHVPGDGRVSKEDALMPKGFRAEVLDSKLSHSDLLNDPEVIKALQP